MGGFFNKLEKGLRKPFKAAVTAAAFIVAPVATTAIMGAAMARNAGRRANDAANEQLAANQGHYASMEKIAREQLATKDTLQNQVQSGLRRANKRRVRGGLFGDTQDQFYSLGNKLGG